jgi:predicted ribosomally synthesized peptide with SipW-like signal peptide
MMKRKAMLSLFVIFLAAAIVGGATMAWFTAKAEAPENVFQAGTVMIEAGQEFVWGGDMGNVNPGDCFSKCIQVYNTGTKNIELRLTGVGFQVDIDWDYLWENWDALCYTSYGPRPAKDSTEWTDWQAQVLGENPAFLAPCPDSGWAMRYVKVNEVITGFEFYYMDGPIAPGEVVELCVIVVFDGLLMNNVWQAAKWEQLNGQFQAVQASNNAPTEVWGAGWDWAAGMTAEQALRDGTSNPYANYFYDSGVFQFSDCCLNTARVTTQEELNAALANAEIERIKLYGEFDGFVLSRGVVIQGGTINAVNVPGEPRPTGIYLNTEDEVTISGVTFDGSGAADMPQGVLSVTGKNTGVNVLNCTFLDLHMGVYFNPGAYGVISGNTFTNMAYTAIGIDSAAGVDIFNNTINDSNIGIEIFKPNVNHYNNTFNNVTTDVVDNS